MFAPCLNILHFEDNKIRCPLIISYPFMQEMETINYNDLKYQECTTLWTVYMVYFGHMTAQTSDFFQHLPLILQFRCLQNELRMCCIQSHDIKLRQFRAQKQHVSTYFGTNTACTASNKEENHWIFRVDSAYFPVIKKMWVFLNLPLGSTCGSTVKSTDFYYIHNHCGSSPLRPHQAGQIFLLVGS